MWRTNCGIEAVLLRTLDKKPIRRADVGKRAGPPTSLIADSAIFQVRCGETLSSKSCTQVTGMNEIVLRAPISAVNVDQQRARLVVVGRKT